MPTKVGAFHDPVSLDTGLLALVTIRVAQPRAETVSGSSAPSARQARSEVAPRAATADRAVPGHVDPSAERAQEIRCRTAVRSPVPSSTKPNGVDRRDRGSARNKGEVQAGGSGRGPRCRGVVAWLPVPDRSAGDVVVLRLSRTPLRASPPLLAGLFACPWPVSVLALTPPGPLVAGQLAGPFLHRSLDLVRRPSHGAPPCSRSSLTARPGSSTLLYSLGHGQSPQS